MSALRQFPTYPKRPYVYVRFDDAWRCFDVRVMGLNQQRQADRTSYKDVRSAISAAEKLACGLGIPVFSVLDVQLAQSNRALAPEAFALATSGGAA